MRNRENKNYRFVSFLPDGYKKIPKKFKMGWKKMRKRETKIIVPFCYVPT